MRTQWLSALLGYVTVELRGRGAEAFINAAARQGLVLWDIRVAEKEVVVLHVQVGDFFKFKPLLRETGCRAHVTGRHGLPFFLDKLGRRKFFAVGLILFIIGLYALSNVVWQVKVEGNEKLDAAAVIQAARAEGIKPFQWKFKLKDPDLLSRQLHAKLPGTSWVGVQLRGTQVIIKIVESTSPAPRPLQSPRNLVAAKSAVVTDIRADKGRPLVKPNTYVRKGDVLISGLIGDENNQKPVVASGHVKGLVWYTSKVEVPLSRTMRTYTGEQFKRFYFVVGNRAVKLTGYGKSGYELSETFADRKTLGWRQFTLPLGWMTEHVMQVELLEQKVEPAEARAIGIERAREDVLQGAGPEARLTAMKVISERIESGKLLMEVHIETEESIAEEVPLVMGTIE